MLDPAQNDTFTDHYLGIPFDLSEVLFIATGNFVQNIPGPLLDRMEVVDFAGYTEKEKAEIAKKYLIPRQLEESGLGDKGIHFTDEAVMSVVSNYTRESGVRQLERQLGAVARKVARKIAMGVTGAIVDEEITADEVRELLGRPKVHPERAQEANEVGIATGMYYTPMGGDIMFVEASIRTVLRQPCDRQREHRARRRGVADSHRPARRRDEGVGARCIHVRDEQRGEARNSEGSPRRNRGAHSRSRGRDSEGWSVGRTRDRDSARVGDVGPCRCAATLR